MWIIKEIFETDYGCEERMPGEPDTAGVRLVSEDGTECICEVADEWLRINNLNEGDEWPEEVDFASRTAQAMKQLEWMDNYLEALSQMEEVIPSDEK